MLNAKNKTSFAKSKKISCKRISFNFVGTDETERGQETCEETGRKRGKIPGGETKDERNEETTPIP